MNNTLAVRAAAIVLVGTVAWATWSCQSTPDAAGSLRSDSADADAVRAVIKDAYFHGAFNEQNTDAMARGFHEDFAIFSARGEDLARYEIETWIEGIQERRARPDFDPASTRMEGRIVSLDMTGGAASAKIELRRDGKLVYTDYLSLLKFPSGWKISAKVYHAHDKS